MKKYKLLVFYTLHNILFLSFLTLSAGSLPAIAESSSHFQNLDSPSPLPVISSLLTVSISPIKDS